jgi:nitric oxide reductase subunit B
MRMPGDIVFSIGAVALTWFVFRLWVAPRREAIEGVTEPLDRSR